MANSKDNLSAYGKSFIGFDEPIGSAMDTIGGWTGTLYNSPTRVTGWNGQGYAMSFNGTNQYVQFNDKIIPTGAKTIRVKFKPTAIATSTQILLNTIDNSTTTSGYRLVWHNSGLVYQVYKGSSSAIPIQLNVPPSTIKINSWNDIIVTDDGLLTNNSVKIYIDGVLSNSTTGINEIGIQSSSNLSIGANSSNALYLNGQLDSIEIYDKVISPIPDKYLVVHNSQYKYHNGTTWQNTTPTEANFKQYGMSQLSQITKEQWKELVGDIEISMWTDFQLKEYLEINVEVEPFNVYDYISELPVAVAYTESTEDIIVSTATEPFDIYDEFGESVEVLYYTDDETVTNADLILEANWSPIDELEGDFEVVTWTDEALETAQRVLDMKAIPQPQFVKLVNPKRVYGSLDDVFVNDISQSYRDEARYFTAGETPDKWYVWNKIDKRFVVTDASSTQKIMLNGMTYKDLNSITDMQWRTWTSEYINIGMFIVDNPRDTIKTIVEEISFEDYLPRDTTTIKNTSLYILNTTAKIDISFDANVLKGILSDDDLTRVQYRVLLNNAYYYPSDGSFTKLGESPLNIELAIGSKDIRIDDWNTLKVEFQDFFGTTDYWYTQFMGTYSGLMFKDVYGQYYSSEVGEVLQYLDFGVIIAGQTTVEHEVILKNQYGYDIKDIHLYANTSNFPTGMTCEFSTSSSPFVPQPDLQLGNTLKNNEEMSFFIRLKTELGSTPDANGSFDIIVRADKA